jgi:deazaflavin-dependent oxidoreductase (nitroreductase family)
VHGGVLRNYTCVPIELPRGVARFNRVVTNPIQRSYAWLLVPWAIICHRGRRSGRLYRTPVIAFERERMLAVVILYGERSDWVQNVLAGPAQVVRAGRTYELIAPRVVDPAAAGSGSPMDGVVPPVARALGRLSRKLLVAELGDRKPGFGPGPG